MTGTGRARTNLTREDHSVENLLDSLDELVRFADGPTFKLLLGADKDLMVEYGDEAIPFEVFEGNEWGEHVSKIADWAEANGFRSSIDTELFARDIPEHGRAIVNISPRLIPAPIRLYVSVNLDGDVNAELRVRPFDESITVYNGSVANLDREISNIREYGFQQKRPFVTGRVKELSQDADVNPSHARAIALRELGFNHDEVAERLDISKGASGSYQSKFNRQVKKSEHLFIARSGVPKRVLAKTEREKPEKDCETFYVCEEISPANDQRIFFVTVRETSEGSVNVDTETFESLGACITEKYERPELEDKELSKDLFQLFGKIDVSILQEAGHKPLTKPTSLE